MQRRGANLELLHIKSNQDMNEHHIRKTNMTTVRLILLRPEERTIHLQVAIIMHAWHVVDSRPLAFH